MPIVYLATLFVVLIVILSALRVRLVYELSGTSLLILGSTRPGILLYSLLFLPGTIIHELSHWLMAEILRVRTGEITILPDLKGEGNRERLGSVATARSDPLRGFLIGVAPFISGLLILVVLGRFLETGWTIFPWWQIAFIIYGIMVVGNSMMISREDRRTWPFILVMLALVVIVVWRMNYSLSPGLLDFMAGVLTPLNQVLGMTAGVNLVMIGGLYATRRLAERVTKRRIK